MLEYLAFEDVSESTVIFMDSVPESDAEMTEWQAGVLRWYPSLKTWGFAMFLSKNNSILRLNV